MTDMEGSEGREIVEMPSPMQSSVTSYDIRRILMEFGFIKFGNVVQLSERTLCLCQLHLARSNSDCRVNNRYTSYGS